MMIGRRVFLAGSTATLFVANAFAANAGDGVFWRATFPHHELILFGYVRIPAALVPDIDRQGQDLISKCDTILLDMGPDVKLPTVSFARSETQSVMNKLSPTAQAEFRAAMSALVPEKEIDGLAGFTANLALLGEGQHPLLPNDPSIGFALMNFATRQQKQMSTLLSDQEVLAASRPVTIERFNAIGPASIEYLLDLRRRVGPIGRHLETLYRARRSGEIAHLGEEMTHHGVWSSSSFIDAEPLRGLLVERLANRPAGSKAFVTMPLGLLSGPMSILDDLRAKGAEITPLS